MKWDVFRNGKYVGEFTDDEIKGMEGVADELVIQQVPSEQMEPVSFSSTICSCEFSQWR